MSLLRPLLAPTPRNAAIWFGAALFLAAPFCTVSESEAKLLHGAVEPNGFIDAAPGKLYEVFGDGAASGGPLCELVHKAETGWRPADVESDGKTRQKFFNIAGRFLPVETVLSLLFDDGDHARTTITVDIEAKNYVNKPAPAEDCESTGQKAYRNGHVVCIVEQVWEKDGQVWAIKFKPYAFLPNLPGDAVAKSGQDALCPLANPSTTLWRVKRALIASTTISRNESAADADPQPIGGET